MEKRILGKTGLEVSVLGFGGAEIGFNPHQTQSDVNELLNAALDAGLNFIDTAAAYKTSERMIGEAIGKRRTDFILATKCGAVDGFSRSDWSKNGIIETIQESLKLLKTDYLDVVQLHSCEAEILKRGEAVEGLERARERGYTRFIGYSGDNEHARFAIEMNVFDTLQTSVNIADQTPIDGNIPLAAKQNLGIIAKRPVANAVWRHSEKPQDVYHHEYWNRLQKLDFEFIKEQDLSTSIGTSLRFTLSIPGVQTAIVGTTKPGRWQENADQVRRGALDPKEYQAIRERWQEIADNSWVGQT